MHGHADKGRSDARHEDQQRTYGGECGARGLKVLFQWQQKDREGIQPDSGANEHDQETGSQDIPAIKNRGGLVSHRASS
jgi:hypothetical protein